jgi:hypothetical protein
VALVAGGAILFAAAADRVPTAQALPDQAIAAPAEPQTHLVLTLGTGVTIALAVFVTAFLLGVLCGWIWRSRRI